MTPDIREKAERLAGAAPLHIRIQPEGVSFDADPYADIISQALLEAYKAGREEALQPGRGWKWELVPDYPFGEVVGPCVCGGWPGGECLKCPPASTPPAIRNIT